MNFVEILKVIKPKSKAKHLTSAQTTKNYDLITEIKPNTLGREKAEHSTKYYELMEVNSKLDARAKCEKNNWKSKLKHSPNKKSKRKRGKIGSLEEQKHESARRQFNSEECFQNKDALVPTYLSNPNVQQISLQIYEQQTGIHKLPKIIDSKGNDYYILDFNSTKN